MLNKNIAILTSPLDYNEGEISKITGERIYNIIKEDQENLFTGCKSKIITFSPNIINELKENNIDLVFNAMHGKYGEDGRVESLFDIYNIKYTHSNFLSSAISFNKIITKKILIYDNIVTPKFIEIADQNDIININQNFGHSFVIKELDNGSSNGVFIIRDNLYRNKKYNFTKFTLSNFLGNVNFRKCNSRKFFIEEYIDGIELSVLIIASKAVGIVEIDFGSNDFYDYDAKYNKNTSYHIPPKNLTKIQYQELINISNKISKILALKDIARIDFIFKNNKFYFIEVNTHPGFAVLAPRIIKANNLSIDKVIYDIIESNIKN